jgi:4a-hydroxytetrahydrobiopterin dehydratase
MSILSPDDIRKRIGSLKGWELSDKAIKKKFTFESFMPAVEFVNRIAPAAEAADHHPDILINYKRVTLTLSTHSEGGVTEKDFALAGEIDKLI